MATTSADTHPAVEQPRAESLPMYGVLAMNPEALAAARRDYLDANDPTVPLLNNFPIKVEGGVAHRVHNYNEEFVWRACENPKFWYRLKYINNKQPELVFLSPGDGVMTVSPVKAFPLKKNSLVGFLQRVVGQTYAPNDVKFFVKAREIVRDPGVIRDRLNPNVIDHGLLDVDGFLRFFDLLATRGHLSRAQHYLLYVLYFMMIEDIVDGKFSPYRMTERILWFLYTYLLNFNPYTREDVDATLLEARKADADLADDLFTMLFDAGSNFKWQRKLSHTWLFGTLIIDRHTATLSVDKLRELMFPKDGSRSFKDIFGQPPVSSTSSAYISSMYDKITGPLGLNDPTMMDLEASIVSRLPTYNVDYSVLFNKAPFHANAPQLDVRDYYFHNQMHNFILHRSRTLTNSVSNMDVFFYSVQTIDGVPLVDYNIKGHVSKEYRNPMKHIFIHHRELETKYVRDVEVDGTHETRPYIQPAYQRILRSTVGLCAVTIEFLKRLARTQGRINYQERITRYLSNSIVACDRALVQLMAVPVLQRTAPLAFPVCLYLEDIATNSPLEHANAEKFKPKLFDEQLVAPYLAIILSSRYVPYTLVKSIYEENPAPLHELVLASSNLVAASMNPLRPSDPWRVVTDARVPNDRRYLRVDTDITSPDFYVLHPNIRYCHWPPPHPNANGSMFTFVNRHRLSVYLRQDITSINDRDFAVLLKDICKGGSLLSMDTKMAVRLHHDQLEVTTAPRFPLQGRQRYHEAVHYGHTLPDIRNIALSDFQQDPRAYRIEHYVEFVLRTAFVKIMVATKRMWLQTPCYLTFTGTYDFTDPSEPLIIKRLLVFDVDIDVKWLNKTLPSFGALSVTGFTFKPDQTEPVYLVDVNNKFLTYHEEGTSLRRRKYEYSTLAKTHTFTKEAGFLQERRYVPGALTYLSGKRYSTAFMDKHNGSLNAFAFAEMHTSNWMPHQQLPMTDGVMQSFTNYSDEQPRSHFVLAFMIMEHLLGWPYPLSVCGPLLTTMAESISLTYRSVSYRPTGKAADYVIDFDDRLVLDGTGKLMGLAGPTLTDDESPLMIPNAFATLLAESKTKQLTPRYVIETAVELGDKPAHRVALLKEFLHHDYFVPMMYNWRFCKAEKLVRRGTILRKAFPELEWYLNDTLAIDHQSCFFTIDDAAASATETDDSNSDIKDDKGHVFLRDYKVDLERLIKYAIPHQDSLSDAEVNAYVHVFKAAFCKEMHDASFCYPALKLVMVILTENLYLLITRVLCLITNERFLERLSKELWGQWLTDGFTIVFVPQFMVHEIEADQEAALLASLERPLVEIVGNGPPGRRERSSSSTSTDSNEGSYHAMFSEEEVDVMDEDQLRDDDSPPATPTTKASSSTDTPYRHYHARFIYDGLAPEVLEIIVRDLIVSVLKLQLSLRYDVTGGGIVWPANIWVPSSDVAIVNELSSKIVERFGAYYVTMPKLDGDSEDYARMQMRRVKEMRQKIQTHIESINEHRFHDSHTPLEWALDNSKLGSDTLIASFAARCIHFHKISLSDEHKSMLSKAMFQGYEEQHLRKELAHLLEDRLPNYLENLNAFAAESGTPPPPYLVPDTFLVDTYKHRLHARALDEYLDTLVESFANNRYQHNEIARNYSDYYALIAAFVVCYRFNALFEEKTPPLLQANAYDILNLYRSGLMTTKALRDHILTIGAKRFGIDPATFVELVAIVNNYSDTVVNDRTQWWTFQLSKDGVVPIKEYLARHHIQMPDVIKAHPLVPADGPVRPPFEHARIVTSDPPPANELPQEVVNTFMDIQQSWVATPWTTKEDVGHWVMEIYLHSQLKELLSTRKKTAAETWQLYTSRLRFMAARRRLKGCHVLHPRFSTPWGSNIFEIVHDLLQSKVINLPVGIHSVPPVHEIRDYVLNWMLTHFRSPLVAGIPSSSILGMQPYKSAAVKYRSSLQAGSGRILFWNDLYTLLAAANAYQFSLHVITDSNSQENWQFLYDPLPRHGAAADIGPLPRVGIISIKAALFVPFVVNTPTSEAASSTAVPVGRGLSQHKACEIRKHGYTHVHGKVHKLNKKQKGLMGAVCGGNSYLASSINTTDAGDLIGAAHHPGHGPSRHKACQMLHDGHAHGVPLTRQQEKYFAALCHGEHSRIGASMDDSFIGAPTHHKACVMLHEGVANGHPLTEAQQHYFGYLCHHHSHHHSRH